MYRPVSRTQSARGVFRFFTVLIAVVAVVIGTIAPAMTAPATASVGSSTSLAPTSGDPAQSGIVKTGVAGFRAGNIISNDVFFDNSTMSAAGIQSFFNGKVPSCQSGYICLKDARQHTPNRPADQYCSGYNGAPNESAATIIYRVGQACGINPEVLIVMLQKEQGLVTHTWPSQWRYDMALGQGCPDTAPCDPAFAGFFYQIYGAARQMQIYAEGKWFTYYAPGNTWNILYHPNSSCGRGAIYVENVATAALYYYTPYQPNAAALNAGYGEGDGCSSYGNRNFYNYFTDWFGPTQPPKPELQPINTSQHLVSVNGAGNLLAYPFGKGAWGDPVHIGAGFGGANIFGVGDLNGDGNRDLIAAKTDGSLLFVSGTGSGYGAVWTLGVSWRDSVLQAAAGDFDGDGIPDMFTTRADGALLLWRGTPQGTLRDGVPINYGWGSMDMLVGGIDMNGDGLTDLIARDKNGALWVYLGAGASGFGIRISAGTGWGTMTAITAAGDFNGDGLPDLFARSSIGDLWLYQGIGGGVVNGPRIGSGWQGMSTLSGPGIAAGGPRALLPGAGDIAGDSGADVVVTAADGRLGVYEGNGRGGWGSAGYIRSDWGEQRQLIPLGDFNGDGRRDLGSIDADGKMYLWAGDGGGGFADPAQIGSGFPPGNLFSGGIDFDGDRRTDLLMRAPNGDLLLYRGNGVGGWVTGVGQWIGNGWNIVDAVFYAGDFDGDGRGDLLARRSDNGTLWLYATDGKGAWKTPRLIGSGWGIMTAMLSPGDFDGDGNIDVLARRPEGTLVLYRGDGRGGWGAVSTIGSGWETFTHIG